MSFHESCQFYHGDFIYRLSHSVFNRPEGKWPVHSKYQVDIVNKKGTKVFKVSSDSESNLVSIASDLDPKCKMSYDWEHGHLYLLLASLLRGEELHPTMLIEAKEYVQGAIECTLPRVHPMVAGYLHGINLQFSNANTKKTLFLTIKVMLLLWQQKRLNKA